MYVQSHNFIMTEQDAAAWHLKQIILCCRQRPRTILSVQRLGPNRNLTTAANGRRVRFNSLSDSLNKSGCPSVRSHVVLFVDLIWLWANGTRKSEPDSLLVNAHFQVQIFVFNLKGAENPLKFSHFLRVT
jgi:hypothetical protein